MPSAVCTEQFLLHGQCITSDKSKNSIQHFAANDTNVSNANTVYGKLAITKYDVGRHIWIIKII